MHRWRCAKVLMRIDIYIVLIYRMLELKTRYLEPDFAFSPNCYRTQRKSSKLDVATYPWPSGSTAIGFESHKRHKSPQRFQSSLLLHLLSPESVRCRCSVFSDFCSSVRVGLKTRSALYCYGFGPRFVNSPGLLTR